MKLPKLLVAVAATGAVTFGGIAVANAAPAESPHATCLMPGAVGNDIENDFFPKMGGCVSSVAALDFLETYEITNAGYNQRCKQLEGLFGGYPMVFEHGPRIDTADNKQECVALLKFFHGGGLGEEG